MGPMGLRTEVSIHQDVGINLFFVLSACLTNTKRTLFNLICRYSLNLALLVEFADDHSEEINDLLSDNSVDRDQGWFYVGMLFVLMAIFRVASVIALGLLAKA